jgi:hypothetical protein
MVGSMSWWCELEAGGVRCFGDALDRLQGLFEYQQERPFDPVAGLVDGYLRGCVRLHVHTRVVGDDSETCAMFVGGLQACRERESRHASGQANRGVGALGDYVSMLVDVPELVQPPERMCAVVRSEVVGLRCADDCLCGGVDPARDAWWNPLPLVVGRWFPQEGEAGLSGRLFPGFQYQPSREMVQRRPRIVDELPDEGVEPVLDERTVDKAAFDGAGASIRVRLVLARYGALVEVVVGEQLGLDRLQVLIGPSQAVEDRFKLRSHSRESTLRASSTRAESAPTPTERGS